MNSSAITFFEIFITRLDDFQIVSWWYAATSWSNSYTIHDTIQKIFLPKIQSPFNEGIIQFVTIIYSMPTTSSAME